MPATFSIPRTNDLERAMTAVMIGVDPHKGSHTAVVISPAEEPLGEIRVRASAAQAEKLAEWAAACITVAVSRSVTALQPSVVLILMVRLDVVTPFRLAGFSGQALRDGRSSDANGRGPDDVAAMLTSGDGRRGGRG